MVTVGRQLEVEAIDLDFQGQGVARFENYVIFIPGVLTGEKALVEIKKVNKDFANAELVELKSFSKKRAHDSSLLGSIKLYHLDKEEQVKWQEKITKDTFFKVAQMDVELSETIQDQRYTNYRNKSVFHVMDEPVIKLGLYLKNYLLTETQQFVLADKVTNKFLNMINRSHIPVERNALTHVVFRTNEAGEVLITFVSKKDKVKGLDLIVKRLSSEKEVVGITLNLKDHSRNILGRQSIVLYGENKIIQKLNKFELPINDRSFFQINYPVMKLVFDKIKDYIIRDSLLVEAYSGIGTFGLSLVDVVDEIDMIESSKQNTRMAKSIKEKYGLDKINIVNAKAEEVIENYHGDVLLVDPPRNGLLKLFVNKVLEMNFKQIIYVSCDVKTLARDVSLLSDKYEVTHIHPIRMFHHTTSIETLVILKQK